jgi:hypothetical protein
MCERVQTSTRVFFHLTWSFISPSAAFKNPGLGRSTRNMKKLLAESLLL